MQQAPGESSSQRPPQPLPRDLVDKAYALIPRRGDFALRLKQQEATVKYLAVWLGDGQPVTYYSPPEQYALHGVRINCTVGECTGLPWIINRLYVRGIDRDYRFNQATRCTLNAINAQTQYMDDHLEAENHPDDVQEPQPPAGTSP